MKQKKQENINNASLPVSINKHDNLKRLRNFAVIGAGAWGTALASTIARAENNSVLYSIEQDVVNEINLYHTNNKYLKDISLPNNIRATNNIEDILNKEVIVIATPSYAFLDIIKKLKQNNISKSPLMLIATKGLASNPARLFSEVLAEELPDNKIAFIAGPNFAKEVAINLYSAATIACTDLELGDKLSKSISSVNFTVDFTDDIITLQIAGIIKNIIAIKSGINDANKAGENARAALVTQALNEIILISKVLGGKENAIIEAGVIGDLVLTSYSKTSRNTKFGYELGKSKNKVEFLKNYPQLVEGKESINILIDLIKSYNISPNQVPIINSVYKILKG